MKRFPLFVVRHISYTGKDQLAGEEWGDLPVAEVAAYNYNCVLSRKIRSEKLTVFTLLVFIDPTYQDRDNLDICLRVYYINNYC